MDDSMDLDPWFIWVSVVFTILTGILTALLYGRNKSESVNTAEFPPCEEEEEGAYSSKEALAGLCEPQAESQLTEDPCASKQQEGVEGQCEHGGTENDCSSQSSSVSNIMGNEDQALGYVPVMLRTSQLEKMMSKEELEEEQRVQREQLAAIFKLLKENQDTFGEVTEKDMEEQLKLYSI